MVGSGVLLAEHSLHVKTNFGLIYIYILDFVLYFVICCPKRDQKLCQKLPETAIYQARAERVGFSRIKKIPYQAPPTQLGPRKCTIWKNAFQGPKYLC